MYYVCYSLLQNLDHISIYYCHGKPSCLQSVQTLGTHSDEFRKIIRLNAAKILLLFQRMIALKHRQYPIYYLSQPVCSVELFITSLMHDNDTNINSLKIKNGNKRKHLKRKHRVLQPEFVLFPLRGLIKITYTDPRHHHCEN